jgi:hypothetical protein
MNDPFSHSVADEVSSESSAARLARYAAEPVTAEDIEQLLRLAKLGQELAEEAAEESRAKNTPDPAQRAQRRRDFDRMTRAMRMTIGLKAKLLFAHNAWQLRKAKAAADEAKQTAERARRTQQRDETLAVARDVIQATQPEHEILKDPGGLGRWYDERDREKPLAGSTLGEVVAGLCKELDVTPDWRQWQGSWVGDAQAAMPYEPPYEPPEIEIVVVGPSSDPDGDDDDEPEEVVAIYRRGPDGRLVEVPKPPAEAAEPPAEEAPAPPARPPPLTRLPRNGEPPMTKEQTEAFRRRRATNPNYLPSPYDPL